jgi:FixJ family two-component response regulator
MDSPDTTHRLSVLIADDEDSFRQVLAAVLRASGTFQVTTCESGEAAINALREGRFDVIVLDNKMGEISGLNVLQWMYEQKMETPAIMLTGTGSEPLAVEAMKLGAYDYLRKDYLDQQHFPLLVRSVKERYLFKKEREQREKIQKEQERGIASFDMLKNAVSSIAHIVNNTLSIMSLNVEERQREMETLVSQEGHDYLNKIFEEMKREYTLISLVSKSLLDLSEIMYQRMKGAQPQEVLKAEEQLKESIEDLRERFATHSNE